MTQSLFLATVFIFSLVAVIGTAVAAPASGFVLAAVPGQIAPPDMCPADPVPPGGACPPECSSCPGGNQCVIECGTSLDCEAGVVNCPDGFSCQVQCQGTSACADTAILCPNEYACEVICDGTTACRNAQVACASQGSCSLLCDGAADACESTYFECGSGSCETACNVPQSPIVECSDSCDCRDGCNLFFEDGFEQGEQIQQSNE